MLFDVEKLYICMKKKLQFIMIKGIYIYEIKTRVVFEIVNSETCKKHVAASNLVLRCFDAEKNQVLPESGL